MEEVCRSIVVFFSKRRGVRPGLLEGDTEVFDRGEVAGRFLEPLLHGHNLILHHLLGQKFSEIFRYNVPVLA